jgi:hypothetical protein
MKNMDKAREFQILINSAVGISNIMGLQWQKLVLPGTSKEKCI